MSEADEMSPKLIFGDPIVFIAPTGTPAPNITEPVGEEWELFYPRCPDCLPDSDERHQDQGP